MNNMHRKHRNDEFLKNLLLGGLWLSLAGCAGTTFTVVEDRGEPGKSSAEATTASGITATEAGLREIGIRWPKPPENVRRYRIERATSKDGSFASLALVDSTPSEYVDRGTPESPLTDASTYFYRMIPESKDGLAGVPSAVVRGMTAPPPKPPKPLLIEAHKSRGVHLKWEAPDSTAITGYILNRTLASAPNDFKLLAKVSALEYEDGGTAASDLRDSTDYLYSVAAVNRVGAESKPAVFQKITTLPPPRVLVGLAGTSREVRCVPLVWKPSPEPDVVRYDIYRSEKKDSGFQKIASVDGRANVRHLDGGNNPGNLADCGTYYYRIRAVNVVTAESADSETAEATTREEPPVVADVRPTPACPRRVPLAWQLSPDERVIGYEVWRAGEDDEFAQVAIVAGRATTNYVDYGTSEDPAGLGALKDDTTYKHKVVAFNYGLVRSSASKTVTVRTKKRPAKPAGLAASTNLPHAVNITWTANPEPDIAEYEVQVSDQAVGTFKKLNSVMPLAEARTAAARESALDNGVARFYRIKAVDRDRLESDWSEVIPGNARPLPSPPARLTAAPVLSGMNVTWDPVPHPPIREYAVWKKAMFKWILVGRTDKPEFVFLDRDLAKTITVAVSAVDFEDLEGPKSQPLDVSMEKK